MSISKKIIYIGKDEKYWDSIQEKFRTSYSKDKFEFYSIYREKNDLFQKLLPLIVQFAPDIIFVDYSSDPENMMTLARLLKKSFLVHRAVIGLWDIRTDSSLIVESNISGIFINHIKSAELSDIIYHAQLLSSDTPVAFPKVAIGKMMRPLFLKVCLKAKIGYMGANYIHVEHDIDFDQDAEVSFKTNFSNEFSLRHFKVIRKINNNFYYNGFRYVSDFEILYKDQYEEIIEPEKTLEEEFKVNENEKEGSSKAAEESLKIKFTGAFIKEKHLEWYASNHSSTESKRTRLLILDYSMSLADQADKTFDSYSYSIRFYREIDEEGSIIERVLPGIIAYQCKNLDTAKDELDQKEKEKSEKESEENKDIFEEDDLKIMISKIQAIENYTPFIIVFNSILTSEVLRKKINYENIMADTESFSFEKLLNYCEVYEEKGGREISHDLSKSLHSKEERIYFSKKNNASNLDYFADVCLIEICESFTIFSSVEVFPHYSFLYLTYPVEMCLSIVPQELTGKEAPPDEHLYFALNNCLTESGRNDLRKYVNEVIFLPKKLERLTEEEEFKAIKVDFKAQEAEAAKQKILDKAEMKKEEEKKEARKKEVSKK